MKNILFICLLFIFGCNPDYRGGLDDGSYQFIIYMKNGDTIKALQATPNGSCIRVVPPFNKDSSKTWDNWYYLPNNEYSKIEFVGIRH